MFPELEKNDLILDDTLFVIGRFGFFILSDNERRPSLGLGIYPAYVFTQNAYGKQLYAAQEQYNGEQGGIARGIHVSPVAEIRRIPVSASVGYKKKIVIVIDYDHRLTATYGSLVSHHHIQRITESMPRLGLDSQTCKRYGNT